MNKSKFLKKSLAMLLAILMVVAMIPLSAAADDAPTDPEPTAPSVAAPDVTVNNRNTTKPQQAGDPYTVTVQDATSVSMAWVPVKDENEDPYSAQVVTKRNVTIGVPFNMLDLLQEGEVIDTNEENNSVTYQVTFQMLDKDKEVVGEWPLQITVVTTIPNDDTTIKTVIANQSFRDNARDFAFLGIKGVVDNASETITITLPVGMDPFKAGFGDGNNRNFGQAETVVHDNNDEIPGVADQNIALRKDPAGFPLSGSDVDKYVRRVFVPTSTYTTVNYEAPTTYDGTGTLVVTARDGRTRNYTVIFEQEEIFETVGVTIGDDSFSWNGTKVVGETTEPTGYKHVDVEYIIPVDDDVFSAITNGKTTASLTFKTLGNVVRVEDPNGSTVPEIGGANVNLPLQSGKNSIGFGAAPGFVKNVSVWNKVITVKTEANMDPNKTGLVNQSFYKNVKITLRSKSGGVSGEPFLQEFQLNGYDSVWNEFAELPPEFDYWVDYDFEFSTGDGQHPARISAYINEDGAISIPAQDRDLVANSYWAVDKTPARGHRLMKPGTNVNGNFNDSVGNCYIANVNTEGGTFVLRVWAGDKYKDYTINLKKPSQSTGTAVDAVKLAQKIDGVWTYLQATKSADGRVWTFEVDNATYGLLGAGVTTTKGYTFTSGSSTLELKYPELLMRDTANGWNTSSDITNGTALSPAYNPNNNDATGTVTAANDAGTFTKKGLGTEQQGSTNIEGQVVITDGTSSTINNIDNLITAVDEKKSAFSSASIATNTNKGSVTFSVVSSVINNNGSDLNSIDLIATLGTTNITPATAISVVLSTAKLTEIPTTGPNAGKVPFMYTKADGTKIELANFVVTTSNTLVDIPSSINAVTSSGLRTPIALVGSLDAEVQNNGDTVDKATFTNNTTSVGSSSGKTTLYAETPALGNVSTLTVLQDKATSILLAALNERDDIKLPTDGGNVQFKLRTVQDKTEISGAITATYVFLDAVVELEDGTTTTVPVARSTALNNTDNTSVTLSFEALANVAAGDDNITDLTGAPSINTQATLDTAADSVAVTKGATIATLKLAAGTPAGFDNTAVKWSQIFGWVDPSNNANVVTGIEASKNAVFDGTALIVTKAMLNAGIEAGTETNPKQVNAKAAGGWYLIVDSPAGSVVTPGGRYNTKVTPIVGKSTWGVGNGFNEKFPNSQEYDELEEGITTLAAWWNVKDANGKYKYLINMQENGAATNDIDKDGMVFQVKNGRDGTQQAYVIRFKHKAAASSSAGAEIEVSAATTGIDEDLVYGGSTVTNAIIVQNSNIVSDLKKAFATVVGAAGSYAISPAGDGASNATPNQNSGYPLDYNVYYNPGFINPENAAYAGAIGGHNEFLASDDKVTVSKVPDTKNEYVITVHVPADFKAYDEDIIDSDTTVNATTGQLTNQVEVSGAIYFTDMSVSSGAKVYRTNDNVKIGDPLVDPKVDWTGSKEEGIGNFVLDLDTAEQQGFELASTAEDLKAFIMTKTDLEAWKGGVFNKDKVSTHNTLFVYSKNNAKTANNSGDMRTNADAIYYVSVVRDADQKGDKLTSVSSASENVTASVNQAQKIVTLNVPASYNWVGTRDSNKYDFELNFTTDSGAILIDAVSDAAFGFRDNGITIDNAKYYDYKNFSLTDLVQQEQDINKWVSAADEPTNATQFFVKDNELFIFNPNTGATQQITGMGDEIKDAFINPSWRLIEDREAELRVYTEGRNNLNTYKLELNILPESSLATLTHVQVDESTAEIDNENRTAKVALPEGTDYKQVRISVGVNGLSTVVSVAGEPYDANANRTYDITNPIEIVIAAENGTEFKYILTAGEVPTPTPTAGPTDEPTPTPTATPTANPDLPSDIDQVTPTLREDVIKALTNGLMQGGPDGLFYPVNPMKRYEFALVVARATLREEGETGSASDLDKILIERYGDKTCVFSDVTDNNWGGTKTDAAVAAINLVVEKGYMQGTSATTFAPAGTITREQAALTMARVAGLDMTDTDVSNFADASKISSWAKGGVAAAYKAGIMNGTGNDNFTPLRVLQRQEGAAILSRYYVDGNGKPEPTDPDEGEEGGEPTNPDEGEEGGEPTNPDEGEEGGEPTNPDEGEEGGEPTNPDEGEEGGEPTPEPDDNGDDTAE